MNVYDFLIQNLELDKIAVYSQTETITFGEIIQSANTVYAMLSEKDVIQADRVAILADNSSFWIASYLGIMRYGAVAVPVPIDQHIDTINHFLEITDCAVCFIDDANLRKLGILPVQHLITPNDVATYDNHKIASTVAVHEDDLAALMFTSGSTGIPNAVKVSHKNIIANTQSIVTYLNLTQDDRIMVVLPFYYCFGTSLLHTHFRVNGSLAINNQFLFADRVLDDIETFECTGFAGVPSIYQRLLRRSSFKERDLASVRLFQQAGGRLSYNFIKDISETFPDKEFYVMYGQTEATSRLTYLPPHLIHEKKGSIGKAIPNVTIEILNENNNPIQPGEHGEIACTGGNITSGYWVDVPNNRYRNGKLYSGDIATIDDEGYIYLVGRKSDFLKPSGNRISSHQLVDAIIQHPDVIEAEVVGIYDDTLGEYIRAFIGVGDNEVTEKDIKRHCLEHLPRFAIPQEIILVDELPKSKAGKIKKNMLLNYSQDLSN